MVLHHVADTEGLLRKFSALLSPNGILCIADLDTEPRLFHDEEAAATVHISASTDTNSEICWIGLVSLTCET